MTTLVHNLIDGYHDLMDNKSGNFVAAFSCLPRGWGFIDQARRDEHRTNSAKSIRVECVQEGYCVSDEHSVLCSCRESFNKLADASRYCMLVLAYWLERSNILVSVCAIMSLQPFC
ncbi:hypothetical protein J6590_053924 [Homalodisca vitripennis]|nr:hypothetical protein J6590_053924 [Homalodisca vitripennis]